MHTNRDQFQLFSSQSNTTHKHPINADATFQNNRRKRDKGILTCDKNLINPNTEIKHDFKHLRCTNSNGFSSK